MQRKQTPRKPGIFRSLVLGAFFLAFLFGPMVAVLLVTGEDSGAIFWTAVYGPFAILAIAAAWSSPLFPRFGRGGAPNVSWMQDTDHNL